MVEAKKCKRNGGGSGGRLNGTICLNPDNRKRLITQEGWSKRWLTSFPVTLAFLRVCLFTLTRVGNAEHT